VPDLPGGVDVISAAFGSDVGVDNEPLQIPGGGYLWVDVTGVKPSRERSWTRSARRSRNAGAMTRSRRAENQSRRNGRQAQQRNVLRRRGGGRRRQPADHVRPQARGHRNSSISVNAVDAIFRAAKDAAGSAEGNSPAEWIIFRLTDITVPDFDAAAPEAKRMTEQVRGSLVEDMLAQYVDRLRADIGATINMEALRRVSSGSSDQN